MKAFYATTDLPGEIAGQRRIFRSHYEAEDAGYDRTVMAAHLVLEIDEFPDANGRPANAALMADLKNTDQVHGITVGGQALFKYYVLPGPPAVLMVRGGWAPFRPSRVRYTPTADTAPAIATDPDKQNLLSMVDAAVADCDAIVTLMAGNPTQAQIQASISGLARHIRLCLRRLIALSS